MPKFLREHLVGDAVIAAVCFKSLCMKEMALFSNDLCSPFKNLLVTFQHRILQHHKAKILVILDPDSNT